MPKAHTFDPFDLDLPAEHQELATLLRTITTREELTVTNLAQVLPYSRAAVGRALAGRRFPDGFVEAFSRLPGVTAGEQVCLELLHKAVRNGPEGPPANAWDGSRAHRARTMVARAAIATGVAVVAAAGVAAVENTLPGHGPHPDHTCRSQPVYAVTKYGNVLDEAGHTVGVVKEGDVFHRDVSGTYNRRNRFYGTVQGTHYTGYVLAQKLRLIGNHCIS